jgi:hypothetical protein
MVVYLHSYPVRKKQKGKSEKAGKSKNNSVRESSPPLLCYTTQNILLVQREEHIVYRTSLPRQFQIGDKKLMNILPT